MQNRIESDLGGDLRSEALKKPTVTQVGILFSIVIFFFIMLGYRVQGNEFYSGILITEFGLIMLPALIFLLVFKYDLKSVLRLNKISLLNLFLIFCIMIFAIPVAGAFNLVNLWLVNSIFGKIIAVQVPVADNLIKLVINILVIGGSAGICEEFLFRGVIQRGFEKFGMARSIVLAAFLFSLTHLDFQKIFGTFFLGALIGFIVYRSNSIFGGMFAHFTNNSIAVIISFAVTMVSKFFKSSGFQMQEPSQSDISNIFSTIMKMPKAQLMITAFFYGFILLVFIMIFVALVYTYIKTTRGKAEVIEVYTVQLNKSLLWVIPGLLMICTIYFMEVMKFQGITNNFSRVLRMLLGA